MSAIAVLPRARRVLDLPDRGASARASGPPWTRRALEPRAAGPRPRHRLRAGFGPRPRRRPARGRASRAGLALARRACGRARPGAAKACRVLAALELGARVAAEGGRQAPALRTPEESARYLLPRYAARPVETFGLLCPRRAPPPEARGGRLRRLPDLEPRASARGLPGGVVSRAAALVLFHNHPSGDPEPSAEDLALTRRLVRGRVAHGDRGPRPPGPGRGPLREPQRAGRAVSRLVYFDCASGASGDMLLGALVDLGLPLDDLRAELGQAAACGLYASRRGGSHRSGLHATKVDVVIEQPPAGPRAATTTAPRRTGASVEILDLLDRSTLDAEVKDRAGGALPPPGRGRGRGARDVARGRPLPRGGRGRLDRGRRGRRDRPALAPGRPLRRPRP